MFLHLCKVFILSAPFLFTVFAQKDNIQIPEVATQKIETIEQYVLQSANTELLPVTNEEIKIIRTNNGSTVAECPINCCASACPLNTVQVDKECFRFIETVMTWAEAKKDCEEQGGSLAIPNMTYPDFAVELSSIYRNIIGKTNIWIGANDMESKVIWKWIDGKVLSVINPSWLPGQPGAITFQNCAQIYQMQRGNLQMKKEACATRRSFLCQFKLPV